MVAVTCTARLTHKEIAMPTVRCSMCGYEIKGLNSIDILDEMLDHMNSEHAANELSVSNHKREINETKRYLECYRQDCKGRKDGC